MIKMLLFVLLAVYISSSMLADAAHAATAQRIVEIDLRDPSADPSISGMVIKTDVPRVKAGRVTLEAVNRSKDLVHEVLVIPTKPGQSQLPYDTKRDTVIEERVHPLGEISDLKPGARGKLTLNLKPGTYTLLCNQPGHYKAGMSTKLVVEK